MFYCNDDKDFYFSKEEVDDIELCLKEYKVLIELALKNKRKPLGKALKKLYQERQEHERKERLNFLEYLFLDLDAINRMVESKKEIL